MTTEEFQGLFTQYMKIRHCNTLEQLRAHAGIGSNTTFLKRWHNPREFTYENLLLMCDYLKIPNIDRLKLLKK